MEVVLASLMVIAGVAVFGVGVLLGVTDGVLKDDGYVTSDPVVVSTTGDAVLITGGPQAGGATVGDLPERTIGTVRVTASSADHQLFVGIADSRSVRRYLAGVRHATVTDLFGPQGRPTYREAAGGAPATTPGDQSFWLASSSGTGTRVVSSSGVEGPWTIVVMNVDGSPGIAADLWVGATLPVLGRLATAGLIAGGMLLAAGLTGLSAVRRKSLHGWRAEGACIARRRSEAIPGLSCERRQGSEGRAMGARSAQGLPTPGTRWWGAARRTKVLKSWDYTHALSRCSGRSVAT